MSGLLLASRAARNPSSQPAARQNSLLLSQHEPTDLTSSNSVPYGLFITLVPSPRRGRWTTPQHTAPGTDRSAYSINSERFSVICCKHPKIKFRAPSFEYAPSVATFIAIPLVPPAKPPCGLWLRKGAPSELAAFQLWFKVQITCPPQSPPEPWTTRPCWRCWECCCRCQSQLGRGHLCCMCDVESQLKHHGTICVFLS